MRTTPFIAVGAAIAALSACQSTPVATPAGLAQWYPAGTAQPGEAPAMAKAEAAPASGQAPASNQAPAARALSTPPAPSTPQMAPSEAKQIAFIRLQHRLADLEEKYQQLWLKYKALEKGLALGLMPPEVTASLAKSLDQRPPAAAKQSALAAKQAAAKGDSAPAPKIRKAPAAAKRPPSASLTAGIKKALRLYQNGKYGQALIALQKLQKQHGPAELNGNDLYWIGLCWYHLKDFSKARESLDVFQTRYRQHNLARKAALYQAKIDLDIGLTKKGVAALEGLIQDSAGDEVAKLARAEIESVHDDIH